MSVHFRQELYLLTNCIGYEFLPHLWLEAYTWEPTSLASKKGKECVSENKIVGFILDKSFRVSVVNNVKVRKSLVTGIFDSGFTMYPRDFALNNLLIIGHCNKI